MNARQITNWLLYGNPNGQPTHTGKSSNEYDDFIKKIFNYNKNEKNTNNRPQGQSVRNSTSSN